MTYRNRVSESLNDALRTITGFVQNNSMSPAEFTLLTETIDNWRPKIDSINNYQKIMKRFEFVVSDMRVAITEAYGEQNKEQEKLWEKRIETMEGWVPAHSENEEDEL